MKAGVPWVIAAGGLRLVLLALASPRAEARVEAPRVPHPGPGRGPHAPLAGSVRAGSGFGWRTDPITKQTAFHRGLDLPVPEGTPVHAPLDGVVERVDRDGVGRGVVNGHAVLLRAGGYRWAFLHLSSVAVRAGQKVQRGQILGRTGQTGRTTGPHLHIQVYDPTGRLVDPLSVYPPGAFARRGA